MDIKTELHIDEIIKVEPEMLLFENENLSNDTDTVTEDPLIMFDEYTQITSNIKLESRYLTSCDLNSGVFEKSSSKTTEFPYICNEVISENSSHCIKKKKGGQKLINETKLDAAKSSKHICDFCGRSYKQKGHLNTHKNIHHQKNMYECETCKKIFLRKDCLTKHLPLHSNVKSFPCDFCSKSFVSQIHMTAHLYRVHNSDLGYSKYQCDVCHKVLCSKNSLQVHLTSVHSKSRPFKCMVCIKSFPNEVYLSRHMSNHNKLYKCIKCNKLFSRRYRLQEHLLKHKTKEYCCNICDLSFLTVSLLRSHVRYDHSKLPTIDKEN